MKQRKTNAFREKCDWHRLSRSPSEICGRRNGAGTDFPCPCYSTNAADQCSSPSGLSETGCMPNPNYSLTFWVTVLRLFFITNFFYVATFKVVKHSSYLILQGFFWVYCEIKMVKFVCLTSYCR